MLAGSVRKSGNRLRVTVQLVQADTGINAWSETYDRELREVFEVQETVANAVVDALKLRLVRQTIPAGQRTQNQQAYEAYLLGRQFQDGNSLEMQRRAREAFMRAAQLDPEFAPAHAGIALAELRIAGIAGPAGLYDSAAAAAERALALAPGLTEAVVARALIKMQREWDWLGAQAELESALKFDANNGELLTTYGHLMGMLGRRSDAVAAERRAVERNPLYGKRYGWRAGTRSSGSGNFASPWRNTPRDTPRRALVLQAARRYAALPCALDPWPWEW